MPEPDLTRTRDAIAEDVADFVRAQLFDVSFALKGALRNIFWHSFTHGKIPEKALLQLDALVDLAFRETRRYGPEDASYPAIDKKKLGPLVKELRELLGQVPDPNG